jgi:hypothetical protein
MSQVVIEHALPYMKHHQEFDAIAKQLEANVKKMINEPTSNPWAKALLQAVGQVKEWKVQQRVFVGGTCYTSHCVAQVWFFCLFLSLCR